MGKSLKQRFEDSYTKYRKAWSWLLDTEKEESWSEPSLKGSSSYAVAVVSNSNKAPANAEEVEMLGRFCELAVFASASNVITPVAAALSACESPIERVLLCAIWIASIEGPLSTESGLPAVVTPKTISYGNPFGPYTLTIEPQAKHGEYRVDFRLTYVIEQFDLVDGDRVKKTMKREVVVECDGHEFHEKTKEQAAKDKARDRELQCSGCPVLHFTGSEIWNDPLNCAGQIIEYLNAVCHE